MEGRAATRHRAMRFLAAVVIALIAGRASALAQYARPDTGANPNLPIRVHSPTIVLFHYDPGGARQPSPHPQVRHLRDTLAVLGVALVDRAAPLVQFVV